MGPTPKVHPYRTHVLEQPEMTLYLQYKAQPLSTSPSPSLPLLAPIIHEIRGKHRKTMLSIPEVKRCQPPALIL
uniref:Uncharacterized protein n=1 Tax=Oryza glumipatula TaxID=40148 RepID=A0A0E0B8R3_9ORYZ